jgi:hypothetical protein
MDFNVARSEAHRDYIHVMVESRASFRGGGDLLEAILPFMKK